MPNIVLHGALRREFGGPYLLDVTTPAEAFRALEANFPGRFLAFIRNGVYRVVRGDRRKGMELDASELGFGLGKSDLHIIPLPKGSSSQKGKGAGKAILGVVIMAAAIVTSGGGASLAELGAAMAETSALGVSYGSIAMFGLTMALTGVSQMLSPQPKASTPADANPSYLFNGPANAVEQGGPVPLIYGRMRVGSTVISSAIDNEIIAQAAATSGD